MFWREGKTALNIVGVAFVFMSLISCMAVGAFSLMGGGLFLLGAVCVVVAHVMPDEPGLDEKEERGDGKLP